MIISDDWPNAMKNIVGGGKKASTAIAVLAILMLILGLLYIMCNDCAEDR